LVTVAKLCKTGVSYAASQSAALRRLRIHPKIQASTMICAETSERRAITAPRIR